MFDNWTDAEIAAAIANIQSLLVTNNFSPNKEIYEISLARLMAEQESRDA